MSLRKLIFGERYLTKVAAFYPDADTAQHAATVLRESAHLTSKQVQVIEPHDQDWGRKTEPEDAGIWRTAKRAHLTLGALGFVAGILLFFGLWVTSVVAVRSTPVLSMIVISTFGLVFGLMAGGLVTLRPDHDAVMRPVQEATRAGRWALVVHASSHGERETIVAALNRTGAPVTSTL